MSHSKQIRNLAISAALIIGCALPPAVGAVAGEVRGNVDETLVWNQVMLDAIVEGALGNPHTIRMAATVNTAMFDARNGVRRK
jgi:hypothetical protein